MFWKSGLLLMFLFFICASSFSQITITQNDVQLMSAVGNSSVSSLDTLTASVNIGNTGSSSWDFSNLVSALEFTSTSIDPSSCPYISSFPGATICKHYVSEFLGYQADNWLFNSINSEGFFLDGLVISMDIAGFSMVTTVTYTSPEEQLKFPLTYGTTWTQDYSYNTETSTGQSSSQSLHTINTVDAYGTIVLPGGQSEPGLRMKRDERAASGVYYRNISYIFYTQSGNAVSFSVADTSSPDHGVINVEGAGWVIGNITGVEEPGAGFPTILY